MVEVCR